MINLRYLRAKQVLSIKVSMQGMNETKNVLIHLVPYLSKRKFVFFCSLNFKIELNRPVNLHPDI